MSISRLRLLAMAVRSALIGALLFLISAVCWPAQIPEQAAPLTDAQLQARDALKQGEQAFGNGQFQEAEQHFTRASELDPTLLKARLDLATTYASQYLPGVSTEENLQMGKLATECYEEVLQMDAQNLSAIDGLASILYQKAGQQFDAELLAESKSYSKKHIVITQQDPTPYYSIGVIDWTLAYRANVELRREFNQTVGGEGLKDSEPLPEALRIDYLQQCGSIVDEGIASLKQAINLNPDDDVAMTYLQLLYRRKADMAATPTERENYTNQADELLDRVKELQQQKAAMPAQPNP
jgi:tetratricopeptide (TPR) repeat protein